MADQEPESKPLFSRDIELVEAIDFVSVDKDNMEFETQSIVTCYQLESLSRMIEFCKEKLSGR